MRAMPGLNMEKCIRLSPTTLSPSISSKREVLGEVDHTAESTSPLLALIGDTCRSRPGLGLVLRPGPHPKPGPGSAQGLELRPGLGLGLRPGLGLAMELGLELRPGLGLELGLGLGLARYRAEQPVVEWDLRVVDEVGRHQHEEDAADAQRHLRPLGVHRAEDDREHAKPTERHLPRQACTRSGLPTVRVGAGQGEAPGASARG